MVEGVMEGVVMMRGRVVRDEMIGSSVTFERVGKEGRVRGGRKNREHVVFVVQS